MNTPLKKTISVITLAMCLALGSASAIGYWHGGGGWHGGWHEGWRHRGGTSIIIGVPGFYGNYYGNPYYPQCQWVGGYYDDYGYWVPQQEVCN